MVTAPPPLLLLLPPKPAALQAATIPERLAAPTVPAEYLRKSRRESGLFLLLVEESLVVTSLVVTSLVMISLVSGCVDMAFLQRAAYPSNRPSSRTANILAQEDFL